MILTGSAISAAIRAGEITIAPYDPARLSPNAYDWRLGDTIRCYDGDLDSALPTEFTEQTIPAAGLVLRSRIAIERDPLIFAGQAWFRSG